MMMSSSNTVAAMCNYISVQHFSSFANVTFTITTTTNMAHIVTLFGIASYILWRFAILPVITRSSFFGFNSTKHVPKINNGEIPSIDEATSDHDRLLERLKLYDFEEHKVAGDGNCQFRALSDQLYNTPDNHNFVRHTVVNQLRSRPENYEEYVPMEYSEYLEKMSMSGEWGDHITLQAASDAFGVRIFVITSFKDTCCIEILPNFNSNPERVIYLSFWAEVHYNSIYPQGDMPSSESRKKKSLWSFGSKHRQD